MDIDIGKNIYYSLYVPAILTELVSNLKSVKMVDDTGHYHSHWL